MATEKGKKGEAISAGIAISCVSGYYVVFEAHGKQKKNDLILQLERMMNEAFKTRGLGKPEKMLIITKELLVQKSYGQTIVAIVFDPLDYV